MMRNVRLYHSARRSLQLHRDMLGNTIGTKFPTVVENINVSMEMMISSSSDASKPLNKAMKLDPECVLPAILYNMEHVRNGTKLRKEDFAKITSLDAGKLSNREKHLSAAVCEWKRGNYTHAANLFESNLLDHPNDVLSLRLAQDCYRAAGLNDELFGVLGRHPQANLQTRSAEGSVLGMMAAGLIERGRLVEAEEIAERAVECSKGKDALALHALLTCFQLGGRSSEILNSLTHHEKHHSGTGLLMLLERKGTAHVLRGNYVGAFKTITDMINELVVTFQDTAKNVPEIYLSRIVFLLWNIYINIGIESMNKGAVADVIKFYLAQENAMKASKSTVVDLSNAMVISLLQTLLKHGMYDAASAAVPIQSTAVDADNSLPAEEDTTAGPNTSYFGKLLSNFNENIKADLGVAMDKSDKVAIARNNKEMDSTPLIVNEEFIATYKKIHYENMLHSITNGRKPSIAQEIVPKVAFFTRKSDLSDLAYARQECSVPLTNALLQFGEGDYESAIQTFAEHNGFVSLFTGGSALERDLLKTTRIEMYMRNEQWDLAHLLLKERQVEVPGDAHTQRKLGLVYRALGDGSKAQESEYQAYQLGLGQGGYGGPV